MELAAIINQDCNALMDTYGHAVLPGQLKAMNAIGRCRTPDSGELYVQCPDCHHAEWRPLSCGHRSCPKCQNDDTSRWIDRQTDKLLPVQYYMATFTLPYQVYSLFFLCVSNTLKNFALNPKNMGAQIGMTMVLHTHARRLDFHLHIHVVVPGGGVDKAKKQWKKKKGRYLFSEYAMARVFRTRFSAALKDAGFSFPHGNAKKLLKLVQLILHVRLPVIINRPRPAFSCPCCRSPMVIIGFRYTPWNPG